MWSNLKSIFRNSSTFRVGETKRKFFETTNADIQNLPTAEAFEVLMNFYQSRRAIDAVPMDEDGDMLLFEWGTYDWGNGEHFSINLTRQLTLLKNEDTEIWQLSLTYSYPPTDKLRSVGSGDKWCERLDQLGSFRSYVLGSSAMDGCSGQSSNSVEVLWEQV